MPNASPRIKPFLVAGFRPATAEHPWLLAVSAEEAQRLGVGDVVPVALTSDPEVVRMHRIAGRGAVEGVGVLVRLALVAVQDGAGEGATPGPVVAPTALSLDVKAPAVS